MFLCHPDENVTRMVLLISPQVFVKLALTSGSLHSGDSRIHLMNACLSAGVASLGNPSSVKEREACFASSWSLLYTRCAPILDWVSVSLKFIKVTSWKKDEKVRSALQDEEDARSKFDMAEG